MKISKAALKNGYRSGLEDRISKQLKAAKVPVKYEEMKIEYHINETRRYTPDFELPNGIIIESKGRFVQADRKKHLLIKKQHPELLPLLSFFCDVCKECKNTTGAANTLFNQSSDAMQVRVYSFCRSRSHDRSLRAHFFPI